jgi:archaellum component FlaC
MKNLLFILFLFITASCKNSGEYRDLESVDMDFEEMLDIPLSEQPAPPPPNQQPNEKQERTKKVVKTGGIDFQTKNIEEAYHKIRNLLPQYEAYIENENQSKTPQRISFNLTIRVPSAVYDTLYSHLTTLAYRLDNRYSNVEDVTTRYYDLTARITNKTALESRYVELLKQASEIKDILEIERNLNEVRTEIEQLQGQFNYLSSQVNYSTINLSFYELLPYAVDDFQRKGFGARLLNSLNSGWQGFLTFLVGLTALWPFFILTVAAIYMFKKVRKRWKRNNA